MKLALLGAGAGALSYTSRRLLEEAGKLFHAEQIPVIGVRLGVEGGLQARYGRQSLAGYDYVLTRIDSRRVGMGYPVVRFLDALGVKKPYPAETILIAHNKFITLEVLASAGVPVPATEMTGSREVAADALKKYRFPVILKLLSGFGGQGVMVMDSQEAAASAVSTMKTLNQEILIEEYVENPGEDVRGLVVGDCVVASFKRVAAKGDRRANVHAGGRGVRFALTKEMEDICLRASRAVRAKICAVDMIPGKNGPVVVEVNINPGIRGIEAASGVNVAREIAEFAHREAKR